MPVEGTNEQANLQAGFSAGKKYFKKATSRNRIKRLMREAYRLQKMNLQQSLEEKNRHIVVFILYVGNEMPGYKLVFDKMNALLKKLQRLIHEDTGSNM